MEPKDPFSEFSEILVELRAKEQLCDGVLRAEDGTRYPVHRAILSAASPYFRALFTSNLGNPSGAREMEVPQVSADILGTIIDYAYTGKVKVTSDNVEGLLPAADHFQISGIMQQCCQFLQTELRPDNCIGIHKFAKLYYCPELATAARRYILSNFRDVAGHSPELLELGGDELTDILSDDELNCKREELVFETILRWVDNNEQERKRYLPSLLRTVRFGNVTYKFFVNNVYKHRYIQESQECQGALFEASVYLAELNSQESAEVDLSNPLARPRIPHDILFAIGGWSAGSPTSFIETYDTRADRWFLSVNTDYAPRAYHGLATVNSLIYMIGGFDGNEHFNTVRCFNPVNKVWSEKACMYTPRCYVSVCVLDGQIYALGGYDGRIRMNTGERYNPEANQWTMIAPMHRQRSDASSASLNGKVYIAGGFNGQEVLSSVEHYDPLVNDWTYVHVMTSPRSGVNLVAHNGCLFALGGFNGFTRLSTGEKYEPSRDDWVGIKDMLSPRSNFATAVLDGLIYVIGGFNGLIRIISRTAMLYTVCGPLGSTTIPFVESYDDASDDWYEVSNMNLNRSALSACVVRGLVNAREYSYLSKIQGCCTGPAGLHPDKSQG
uniref:Kelch-like protein diablo n=1 Tax=Strigamia maritima TaxID=126957 RepID=T1IMJ6_STRMM